MKTYLLIALICAAGTMAVGDTKTKTSKGSHIGNTLHQTSMNAIRNIRA